MDLLLQLLFNEQSTDALREVWHAQAAVTGSRTLIDGPYDPHITLGLFKDLDHATFSEELRTLAATFPEFEVRFGHVGQFSGDEGTLFLVPVRNPRYLPRLEREHCTAGALPH
jgi:2'-5' RNA ligase